MSIRINSFGGPIIWLLRKYCSYYTSKIALSFAASKYDKDIKQYIDYCFKQEEMPFFMNFMIETVNRCNGTCSFCPANREFEKRPFKKMSEELFRRLIDELRQIGWTGTIYLNINNEPFVDIRILDFADYAKKTIPNVSVELITNGTLLSIDKLYKMRDRIDRVVINDYSCKYKLSSLHKSIYREVKRHTDDFRGMEITINRRYSKEILATRAGMAPNKKKKNNTICNPCIYPFTDFLVFPDGKVGMCCNDCYEISEFGNLNDSSILSIWNNDRFRELRIAMRSGDRSSYPFCKECDVVDAGEREKQIHNYLKIFQK